MSALDTIILSILAYFLMITCGAEHKTLTAERWWLSDPSRHFHLRCLALSEVSTE